MDQRLAILVEDLRADRHLERDRLAVGAVAVLAHAVGALGGLEVLLIAVIDQRVEAIDDFDDDIAAAAAIAAGGSAEFDILLAPERDAAVTAVAGADVNLGFIEEFHGAALTQISIKAPPFHALTAICAISRIAQNAPMSGGQHASNRDVESHQIAAATARVDMHDMCAYDVSE